MRGGLLFWRSRFTLAFVFLAGTASFIVHRYIMWVPEVSLDWQRQSRFVPALEVIPVALAVIGPTLMYPRFRHWERLSQDRLRLHNLAVVVICLTVPLGVMLVGAQAMPQGDDWAWIPANVLIGGSLSLMLTDLAGRMIGASVSATIYFLVIIAQHLWPAVAAQLPLASGHEPTARWWLAFTMALIASVCYVRSGGQKAWR